jgi:soluble lytic murein transglycosylase
MLNAGASEEDRAKLLFWRGRAEMDADVPNATGALGALVAEHAGTFYALRAEVLLENNETSHPQPDLSPPPVDWNAIADYMFAEQGIDPRIVPAGTTEDQRWTIGAALEDAGLHDESVAVYLDMLFDKRLPGGPDVLFRATRRLAEEGRTSLAARAATALIAALESAPGTRAPDDLYRVAYPLAYGDLAAMAADDEDVSPLLLLSLVRQESFYDPLAGSSAGALGLTQVIEPTGRSIASVLGIDGFAVTDLYRPKLSLRFGANYISDQLDQFDGNVYHALAAYNGGPGTASNAIDTAGDDIDLFVEDLEFDETKLYVKLVMENYARYRQLYAGLDRPSLPD